MFTAMKMQNFRILLRFPAFLPILPQGATERVTGGQGQGP
jgi:hypothetical protein